MPNWCWNEATLIAPNKEQIDRLVASLEQEDVSEKFFNHLRPRPVSESENWYEWNVNNWGTKWDTEPHNYTRLDDTTISFSFDTAWGPPLELYNFLFDEGWDVTARYHESGMGFVGEYDNSIDDCWEYSYDDESSIDAIPEELNEWAGISEDYNFHKEMNDEDNAE